MPRPRSQRTAGLPDYVYCGKGRWYYRPPGGIETKLAPASAKRQEVWMAYHALMSISPAPAMSAAPAPRINDLVTAYRASPTFKKLSANTQKDLDRAIFKLTQRATEDGMTFGDQAAEAITPGVIRLYLDARGSESITRANREVAYLSQIYTWAAERDMVTRNPCLGVRRHTEKSRERYVTDQEYAERFALAGQHGRADIQAMMELAFLCRLRESEILRMLDAPSFIDPANGVLAKRSKGSKTQWIEWSPRLVAAIELARSTPRKVPTPMLIVSSKRGRPLTLAAFSSAWTILQNAAAEQGHATDWNFHDLKAKGVSDAEGDKHLASGHKTHRMTAVYDRKHAPVKPTR